MTAAISCTPASPPPIPVTPPVESPKHRPTDRDASASPIPIPGTFFATPPKDMRCAGCGDALSIISGCNRGRGEFYTHSPFTARTDPNCFYPTAVPS